MKISRDDLAKFVPALRQPGPKKLLHIGCGTSPASRLPGCFKSSEWQEIRLDVDPAVKPDIVASLTDMSTVSSGSVDAVWSSHSLEHIEGHEVPTALTEMRRILRPGGFALITLPDLQRVAQLVAEGRGDDVMYTSPAGPITPLDMMFGHQASLARGNSFMSHRTGFTADRLGNRLTEAGFDEVRVMKGTSFDLWALAVIAAPPPIDREPLRVTEAR